MYSGAVIKSSGAQTLRCFSAGTHKRVHFEVIADAPVSLLSGRACEALGLMEFSHDQLINTISSTQQLTREAVLKEYQDVFHGLGKLPGCYHIEVDPSVTPVQNTRRRVPIPVRAELKSKIDDMEKQELLAKVEEPTPWISNLVVVRKPNKLRLCLDPIHLNKAIKRNHYPIPLRKWPQD